MPPRVNDQREPPESTAERLLTAASNEFNEHGFAGTDTNKIARSAGFAPQTFYRWFKDKVHIFVKVYERWQYEEFGALTPLLANNASDVRVARVVVAHHRAYLGFRRSLRQLSIENDVVRAARAKSRLKQVAYVQSLRRSFARDDASIAAMLFQSERLADALAEGEFRDMGLKPKAGEDALARIIGDLRRQ